MNSGDGIVASVSVYTHCGVGRGVVETRRGSVCFPSEETPRPTLPFCTNIDRLLMCLRHRAKWRTTTDRGSPWLRNSAVVGETLGYI